MGCATWVGVGMGVGVTEMRGQVCVCVGGGGGGGGQHFKRFWLDKPLDAFYQAAHFLSAAEWADRHCDLRSTARSAQRPSTSERGCACQSTAWTTWSAVA
jgi:hypothetical protein